MGKKSKPKLANCSPQDVFKALKKLGGFVFSEGRKHVRITHIETGKKSTIPRKHKKPLNKHLLKDFVEDWLVKELGYSEDDIYKHLKC